MGKQCAGAACSATSNNGGGTDGQACLIAKPKCNKMGGGDATVACAVSGVAANADRDAFQLKFKPAAATTLLCQKGTCAADKAQSATKTAEQTNCCEAGKACSDIFIDATKAESCKNGVAIAAGSSTTFNGNLAGNPATAGFLPAAASAAADWAALSAMDASIVLAARNRCCANGNDLHTR